MFRADGPHVLGTTVENLVSRYVHPWAYVSNTL